MGPLLLAAMMASAIFTSNSYYPTRLDDSEAIYLSAKGDGVADDTAAIQKAIDDVPGEGIVFIPSGRYRITDTIRVWPGVRVVGYGATRPTFLLAPRTPGYQLAERYMVFFAGRRPGNGEGLDLDHPWGSGIDIGYAGDAGPGTFYSAMSNVDLEIGGGNPSAVGVRGTYAQHCFLSHMDFRLGTAFAGIHDTGNVGEDLRFFGGRYGVVTRTPSPGWPYTLLDSTFEGQSEAAIRTITAGLTLIRPTFRKVPTAVEVEPERTEQLWVSDARMEDVSGPAIVVGRENSLRTQISVENVACHNVPTFAKFRESGKELEGKGSSYVVRGFEHGLSFDRMDEGTQPALDEGVVQTRFELSRIAQIATDIPKLPASSTWANLLALGAKGDGETDDTAVLKAAIDKYPAIYLPSGRYRVTEPIRLKPETVLIGLHPFTTQILIQDGTPAFAGQSGFPGEVVPLIEAPKGGKNVVTGIGLDTGGANPAACALLWKAGDGSMLNDVKFLGGHGSVSWNRIYNANHTADPDPSRKWDSQYPSLWVTDGGGGTFLNLWTASTFASAGMLVSNTSTPGRVYEVSTEHHVRNEVILRNAANWSFYGLQAEEERGEGPFALPIEIDSCGNVLIANLNVYRVISMEQPFPCAIRSANSSFRLRNIHCNSNSKASFDSLLVDSSGVELRQREFQSLTWDRRRPGGEQPTAVRKLAGGFFNISGGAVDANGNFCFVDARFHRIYRWSALGLETVSEAPLSPVNLFVDDAGNLVVVSYAGQGVVYAFRPGENGVKVLSPQPVEKLAARSFVLPVSDFDLDHDLVEGRPVRRTHAFVAPDGTTVLPVEEGFLRGETSWGVKAQSVIRSFGLAKAKPGETFYFSGENDSRTYAATVGSDGSLLNGRLFAEQGGEGVAVDRKGNVYLAAGQIFVYNPAGKHLRTIHVPERPSQLAFGGPDGKTLFICARTSLYAVRL